MISGVTPSPSAAVQAPEAGDDLVEDQQDAVPVADRAQPLQIAEWRRIDATRTRHWLHDDGGHGGGVLHEQDVLECRHPARILRGAAGEEALRRVVRQRHVEHIGQQRAEIALVPPTDNPPNPPP